MKRPTPAAIAEGQESVWDYPRPPRLEPTTKRLEVHLNGVVVADTRCGWRVLETSHPPVYYFPPEDVRADLLVARSRGSFCEWKGRAVYFTVRVGDREAVDVAWAYPDPLPGFAALRNHLAFYAGPMDVCLVGGETVTPQPGGFYGGWITPDIVGPFKGGPGSMGW
jgi:uncharacterized protein (DUF427 family)